MAPPAPRHAHRALMSIGAKRQRSDVPSPFGEVPFGADQLANGRISDGQGSSHDRKSVDTLEPSDRNSGHNWIAGIRCRDGRIHFKGRLKDERSGVDELWHRRSPPRGPLARASQRNSGPTCAYRGHTCPPISAHMDPDDHAGRWAAPACDRADNIESSQRSASIPRTNARSASRLVQAQLAITASFSQPSSRPRNRRRESSGTWTCRARRESGGNAITLARA